MMCGHGAASARVDVRDSEHKGVVGTPIALF
jgi:hypothetical protein